MFTLGIHIKDIRRTNDVLQHSRSEPFNYDLFKQDEDFYILEFPNTDYEDFKRIVLLLKNNGITAIGADTQLSEKKIMKLVDLIKEKEEPTSDSPKETPINRMESAEDIIAALETILEVWEKKTYNSDQERYEMYYLDISELVEDYKENLSIDTPDVNLQEQKLRKLIRKIIKE